MKAYSQMTPVERKEEYARLQAEFEGLKAKGLQPFKFRLEPGGI